MALLLKNELNAFQNDWEPTHLTTLEVGLRRIWVECGYAGMVGAHTCGAQILGDSHGTGHGRCPALYPALCPRRPS